MFGKDINLYPFLESISKCCHMILVIGCLTSLRMIVSTSFLVAVHGLMSSFLWLSNIALCASTQSCSPIHLSLPT